MRLSGEELVQIASGEVSVALRGRARAELTKRMLPPEQIEGQTEILACSCGETLISDGAGGFLHASGRAQHA